MKRDHCLALVTDAYGGRGGIAQYNRDLFDAMARTGGQRIDILPRHGDGQSAPPPAGVTQRRPIAMRLAFTLRAIWTALMARPGIIFCGHLFMAPLAGILARLTGAALVIQLHGIECWPRPGPWTRRAMGSAQLVLCVSRDTRARMLKWADLPPERAVVASNTMRVIFAPGDIARARARFGVAMGRKVLLTVGRLDARERYKGQDLVIAALPSLVQAGLDPLYLIAGDGDDRRRLEMLAREKNVTPHVRFLGNVDDDALAELYRAADLFVLPSSGEGFGIVFLEAMACGTPVLGLAAAGALDALCDGELGAAIAEKDLAETMHGVLAASPGPPSPDEVERRFGRGAFAARVSALMNRIEPQAAA